jgi:hypothetical protein
MGRVNFGPGGMWQQGKQTLWHRFRLKVWLIWNILRGKPAMYRVTVLHGGLSFEHPNNHKALFYESMFLHDPARRWPPPAPEPPGEPGPVMEKPWWERIKSE